MNSQLTDRELDQLHIRNWQEVELVLNSKGWQTVIGPILEKMITDVIGKKNDDGTWDSGSFGDKRLGEVKADRLLWYRQFGIDFTNRILSLRNLAERAKKRLEKEQSSSEEKSNIPMFDSSYASGLEEGSNE